MTRLLWILVYVFCFGSFFVVGLTPGAPFESMLLGAGALVFLVMAFAEVGKGNELP